MPGQAVHSAQVPASVRNRSFILVAAIVAALCVIASAVYAVDHGRRDRIADGVRIGGVDVGGLNRAQAQSRVESRLLGPLRRPIVINHASRRWHVSAKEARVGVDIATAVDLAISRSRGGGLLTRTWRAATGGNVNADIRPTITYSDRAIVRVLDHVRKAVDRPSKDASLTFAATGFEKVESRDGLEIDSAALHRRIREAITSTTASRRFVARTRHVEAKVTTDKLADKYSTLVLVDRGDFRLTLFKRLKAVKTYGIAVGQVGLETPAGLYHVQNKAINPAWHVPNSAWAGKLAGKTIPGGTPENPIKSRWLGIFAGAGIHGTSDDASIGSAASHGCIRMHIPDVEVLYDEVPVGAAVYIA